MTQDSINQDVEHSTGSNSVDSATSGNGARQQDGSASPALDPQQEAVAANERIAALEAALQQARDDRLRALAELENLRRRSARERQESAQFSIANFARDILSVADNLQRALATAKKSECARDPALDALVSGIEMTENALIAILARHGIVPIDTTDAQFDPNFHEAMFEIEDTTVPNGTVVQEIERGYRIHDRLLRAARVGIAKGGPKSAGIGNAGGPSPGAVVSDDGEEPPIQ